MTNVNNQIKMAIGFVVGVLIAVALVSIIPACSPSSTAEATSNTETLSNTNMRAVVRGTNLPTKEPLTVSIGTKSVRKVTIPLSRTISIYGEVSDNATTAALQIAAFNKASTTAPIFIVLESPGGSVIHGAQLISAMQASQAPVHTICRTICASMAFMIFEYGKKRYATDRTTLMSHPASASAQGQVDNMVHFVTYLQRMTNKMELEVATRMGLTFDQYKLKTANEYWVDAEDGIKDRALDEIISLTVDQDFNLSAILPSQQGNDKNKLKFDIKWM